ncbi:tryptophan-rich sensory protein TspO [Pseudooctadecabacter sp.]|uniref:tryptophan-rich sensory protein TspO n=1 Tax=Pseudooctadecabacter sp. TaxID=1966338 RepID=UPI0025EFFA5C|nr:TspO/MBR family protein [Pseudooctadecabacter sp.]
MDIWLFFLFLAATFAAGATGAMFPPGKWYERLEKPGWTPPNWMFPVAWTTLYLLMSFAGARVAGEAGAGFAMGFWALQIALNTLWTPVFFGLRRLREAVPIMGALWIAVAGCMVTHWMVDTWAGLAFVPYLAWVTVAGALNISVARRNPDVAPVALQDQP